MWQRMPFLFESSVPECHIVAFNLQFANCGIWIENICSMFLQTSTSKLCSACLSSLHDNYQMMRCSNFFRYMITWQVVLQMCKLDFCIVDNYTLSKFLWCNWKTIPGLWHFHHVYFFPVQTVTSRHWSFVSQKYLHCLSCNSLLGTCQLVYSGT